MPILLGRRDGAKRTEAPASESLRERHPFTGSQPVPACAIRESPKRKFIVQASRADQRSYRFGAANLPRRDHGPEKRLICSFPEMSDRATVNSGGSSLSPGAFREAWLMREVSQLVHCRNQGSLN